jgi:hypothetical protein
MYALIVEAVSFAGAEVGREVHRHVLVAGEIALLLLLWLMRMATAATATF